MHGHLPDGRRAGAAALAASLLSLLAISCAERDYKALANADAVEKAKITKELQVDAARCYQEFRKSGLTDLDALQCYVEKWGHTTEIHPSPMQCQICYFKHGEGLRLLGMYFSERRDEAVARVDRAGPEESAELRAQIEDYTARIEGYFELSNEMLEAYFSTRQAIDPRAYYWAAHQYGALGDYRRALQYLDMVEATTTLSRADQRSIEEKRKDLRGRLRQREFDSIDDSIGGARP